MLRRSPLSALLLLALLAAAAPTVAAAPAGAPVHVILWFDTEDYLLEADDDATLRLARWLEGQGVRATFKIVGEKARVLEKRGRRDVIAALKRHDIGYHSNFHSTQPTPATYMSALGWDEGVAEFVRREGPGVADLKRIFGVTPSCYGQPGSSWGPQSYGAMARLGIKVYLDSASHVALDGKPHYYGGALTMLRIKHTLRTALGGPKDLEEAKTRFRAAHDDLQAAGGGLVSVYYHPNEWVHREFWDAVNFAGGANPPRAEWKAPGMKPPEETRIAWETFEGYVRFIKSFPAVRFITATDAARLYRDKALKRRFGRDEIARVAAAVGQEVGFQVHGDVALAPSEVLALLTRQLAGRPTVVDGTPFGPSEAAPPLTGAVTTRAEQLRRTAADVADYIDRHGRVPSTVWLGSLAVPPEAFLVAAARLVADELAGRPAQGDVELRPARLLTAAHVADDDPKLWGWVIFPRGFRAPAMMALAKRQAWTLKPALADIRATLASR